jgi:hypothetical protein
MLVGLADPRSAGEPPPAVDPGPHRRALSELRLAVDLAGAAPAGPARPAVPPTAAADECRARLDGIGVRNDWVVAPACDGLAGTGRVSLGALFAALEAAVRVEPTRVGVALRVAADVDEANAVAHVVAVTACDPREVLHPVRDRIELTGGRLAVTSGAAEDSGASWTVEAWLPT